MENSRNMILAIVLSVVVLIGWGFIAERIAPTANEPSTEFVDGEQVPVEQPESNVVPDTPVERRELAEVLSDSQGDRIVIESPRIEGSMNLRGARFDDLVLTDYRVTIDPDSPAQRLLAPAGVEGSNFAEFGWAGGDIETPGRDALWQADAERITPGEPVTLRWRNGTGQLFAIVIELDENYRFQVSQRVSNFGDAPVSTQSYALIQRTGESPDPDNWLIHTGPTYYSAGDLDHINFGDVREEGTNGNRFALTNGWLGFNDKYWLTALFPQSGSADAAFQPLSGDRYQAVYSNTAQVVQPGRAITTRADFFAGAKEVTLLEAYDEDDGLTQIDLSVDWGWFYFFELPLFYVLHWLFMTIGNFGVAIICLTIIVRGLMFPIAQKQFKSFAAMRAIQPKMKELQERHKDDKQKMQQEVLALYQKEKVNPLAGCLPMFLQIPIFYALYKVLMLSVEMRHEPFALWLKDLSAPDPLTPVNLFGFLDFTPPTYLAIGILPILLGVTMWLQFKLNPAQMDPTQQKIFGIMPWVFMVIMAPFAAGLQLYWTTSNILTIAQQKWLYSRDPRLKEQAKAVAAE
ncbi:MAG: membrane protein insertase YidC [Parasphingopyxis sp.]|uniref:membrane protein insertase YidC n=1 Tax=Parasphingopyxis sp. TaxID=1920299 RepID=UPI0026089B1E|nr:membrane protein insertase YidC [uncultured Parasphingopyxis sp.]